MEKVLRSRKTLHYGPASRRDQDISKSHRNQQNKNNKNNNRGELRKGENNSSESPESSPQRVPHESKSTGCVSGGGEFNISVLNLASVLYSLGIDLHRNILYVQFTLVISTVLYQ